MEAAAAAIREGQRRASCGKVTRRRRTLRARLPGAASMWTLLRSRTGRALSKARPIRGRRGKASCLAPRWAWRCGRRGAFVRTNAWMCGCVGWAGGVCMLVVDCWCWCLWCVCARARACVRASVRPSVRPRVCRYVLYCAIRTYMHAYREEEEGGGVLGLMEERGGRGGRGEEPRVWMQGEGGGARAGASKGVRGA